MTTGCTVLHGCHEGVHVLRLVGDVRYPVASSVTGLVTRVFDDDEVTDFVVDLSESTSIDSTNLGVLARLGIRVNRTCGHPATVITADPHIRELLESMGISGVCQVVDHGPTTDISTTAVIESEPVEQDQLARVMLDAHRALMDLSNSNHDQFVEVVRALETAAKQS